MDESKAKEPEPALSTGSTTDEFKREKRKAPSESSQAIRQRRANMPPLVELHESADLEPISSDMETPFSIDHGEPMDIPLICCVG
jgi:hypothetical protein